MFYVYWYYITPGYLLFRVSYQMLMTIASFEIAREIHRDAYGLIFGINTWQGRQWHLLPLLEINDPQPHI